VFKRSASNIASIEPHWTGSDRVGRRCRRGRIRAGQTGMQPDVRACSGRTWSVGIALQDHWNGRPLPGGFDSPASALGTPTIGQAAQGYDAGWLRRPHEAATRSTARFTTLLPACRPYASHSRNNRISQHPRRGDFKSN
jgi:hypothetical protein